MSDDQHVPVLLDRTLELLGPALTGVDPVLVDATLGLGGHTQPALERFETLHVIGIDTDPEALERSRSLLGTYASRVTFVETTYDRLAEVLAEQDRVQVDAVLLDLGVSSMQLDTAERGFSYARDTPLDMRMSPKRRLAAVDVVNTYTVEDLTWVLRTYGEERFARRIADAVVAARRTTPVRTSADLVELVRSAVPAASRRTGGNPAKRTFQALRIEVNDEIGGLRRALPQALDAVCVGGRVVVLAYHSLEDRIVKQTFTTAASSQAPPDLPVVPRELEPRFRLLTRGAEVAGQAEVARNRRAQSVRLRAIERIGVAA